MGGSGALDYRLRPAIVEQYEFCGVALTVDAGPGDNLALVHDLQDVQPGDVLMASTGGFTGCAITGDLVLGMAKNCGAVGFVTDGCVRDLVGLRNVGLPAWAIGVTPNSPQRHRPGTIGFAIALAGHPVASGDIVVADLDGVVVVPQERLAEVLARLQGGNPMEAVTRRAPGLEYDPTAQVDMNLLNASKGEKRAGWLGALLGGGAAAFQQQRNSRYPMDERAGR
jgi:4-hydroxy-4-methyl-2-oxoglutarate aldolase